MDIYGQPLSPFTQRVLMAARHKGIKFKLSMPKDGSKSPAFLKLNPFGKTPVIKDGKTVLFESGVILDYFDAKFKKKRLYPTVKAAAQARLIGVVYAEYVQPAILALFGQLDPAKRDQAVVDAKLADINRGLNAVENLLAAKPFAAGSKFTIADCYLVPGLYFLHAMLPAVGIENPLGGRKKLGRYMAKMRKDKIAKQSLAEMDAAFKAMRAA